MAKLNRAARRVRSTKGSSFLTHGGDDYDHKGLNKARRDMDKAVIAEQLEEGEVFETPKNPTSWRLVVETQVYENYGAHDWDGEGECPQHWKAKDGDEYFFDLGGVADMISRPRGELEEIAEKMCRKVTRNDEYIMENPIGWSVLSNLDETHDERMEREMAEWGYPPRSYQPTVFTLDDLT